MSVVVSSKCPVLAFSTPALQRPGRPSAGGIQAYSMVQVGSVVAYAAEKEVVDE